MAVYKENQGIISRIGSVTLFALIGAYAGYSFYAWNISIDVAKSSSIAEQFLSVPFIGGILLFVGLIGLGVNVSFFRPYTSDFLIDLDLELRKVVWPDVLPLFDPKAEAWGATYVVIVTTIITSLFIGLVDKFFNWTLAEHLLRWLLA